MMSLFTPRLEKISSEISDKIFKKVYDDGQMTTDDDGGR